MTPFVTFTVCLPYKLKNRGKWFLASCEILDVHSQGETEVSAIENLKEALELFFISCFERGTLETVLRDRGFTPASITKRKIPTKRPKHCIDVPISFLQDRELAQTPCHA